MKLSLEAKRITTEFWLATLRIEEPGKVTLARDFVVTEQQLAFLHVLATPPLEWRSAEKGSEGS